MCTVSWVHDESGYQLLCNRDEKRTRAAASGPQIKERSGVRYIAPIDGDYGGSWLSANELGVSICLLNGASLTGTDAKRQKPDGEYRSRGRLILDLANSDSLKKVCERISRLKLSVFAPFTIAVLEPGQHTAVIEWNGERKLILPYGDPFMPLISSSFDPDTVRVRRRHEFVRRLHSARKLDADILYSFHESHCHQPDAYSPCMHRPDAHTVSFSWITVTESGVEFVYSPAAPCHWHPGQQKTLARRARPMNTYDSPVTADCFGHPC